MTLPPDSVAAGAPPEAPPGTPADVIIQSEAPRPILDPTLGIAVTPPDGSGAKHRLVALGDSLSQGFQSFAIFNTALSYPALIAKELGWLENFRYPTYEGYGGLPFNLEECLHRMERWFRRLNTLQQIPAALWLAWWCHRLQHWWTVTAPRTWAPAPGANHNLSVYGYTVADALTKTGRSVQQAMVPQTRAWSRLTINAANDRAASRVFANADADMNLADIAAGHGEDGGIETLVVALGSNNALGVVINLDYDTWATPTSTPAERQKAWLWSPTLFAEDWARLMTQVTRIRAAHVIVASVPHVTIAPICAGVGRRLSPSSRYYEYYTHAWLRDYFELTDPHLTGDQARAIDSATDQYNEVIREAVAEQRRAGNDWYYFDLCGLLDRLAYRRYLAPDQGGTSAVLPSWWEEIGPYPLPAPLQELTPPPDTRFFISEGKRRTEGGLVALDGVHPTTTGYGLMAQEIIKIMEAAGVAFYPPGDGGTPREGPIQIDFAELLQADSLMTSPPHTFAHDLKIIGRLDNRIDLLLAILGRKPG